MTSHMIKYKCMSYIVSTYTYCHTYIYIYILCKFAYVYVYIHIYIYIYIYAHLELVHLQCRKKSSHRVCEKIGCPSRHPIVAIFHGFLDGYVGCMPHSQTPNEKIACLSPIPMIAIKSHFIPMKCQLASGMGRFPLFSKLQLESP